MKCLKNICALALASTLLTPVAFAGQAKDSSQKQQSAKAEENLKQVEGTIIQHKFVNVFKDKNEMQSAEKSGKAEKQMLVVLLKTEKGNDRLVVDLGEMKDVSKIKNGETKLQVEGKLVSLGNSDLFVAKRAKIDGSVIEIQRKKS